MNSFVINTNRESKHRHSEITTRQVYKVTTDSQLQDKTIEILDMEFKKPNLSYLQILLKNRGSQLLIDTFCEEKFTSR